MKKPFSIRQASARWWLLLAALVAASLASYLGPAPAPAPARLEGSTMGTTWSVVLGGPRAPQVVEGLRPKLEALLAEVNASMSTWDPDSELSRFNRHQAPTPVEISAPLAEVIALSLEVHRASQGAFDVTVGPLVDAWGFGPAGRPARQPAEDELAALLAFVGSDKLTLAGRTLAKAHPKLRVDLSAVAKGDAVDRLSDLLVRLGEPNHLVEIGGELRARGKSARGEAFRVGIEEPDPGRQAVRRVVRLEDRALATSGNYRNFLELEGRRVVHTIDPRTGQAAQHGLLSVSVLHPRCAAADAWATALMAAGPARAWALAEANGLEVLLLLDGGDGGLVERASPGFTRALLPPAL